MARYKHYDYNQLMMVPVSLGEQLIPGTLEHAIHHVVEERVDLSIFEKIMNSEKVMRYLFSAKIPTFSKVHFAHARHLKKWFFDSLVRPLQYKRNGLKIWVGIR